MWLRWLLWWWSGGGAGEVDGRSGVDGEGVGQGDGEAVLRVADEDGGGAVTDGGGECRALVLS